MLHCATPFERLLKNTKASKTENSTYAPINPVVAFVPLRSAHSVYQRDLTILKMRFFVLQLIICSSIVGNSCEQNPAECGVQKIKTKDLINRGYDTYPGQFPWHVGIFLLKLPTSYFEYACGGSLISSTFVLTARHCTTNDYDVEFNKKRLSVYMGIHNRTRFDQHSQKRSVKTIHSVPRVGRWVRLRNDIALLELDSGVRFTDYVQPICLNSLEKSKLESGMVVGWGKTEGGVFSETLKAASMPIRSHMECFASNPEVFGSTLDYGTICAGYQNGTSVSNGDSGGGLVVKRCFVSRCSWSLAGIVAFAAGNIAGTVQSDGYGAFTEVQMYLPWIEQITNLTFKDDVSGGYF